MSKTPKSQREQSAEWSTPKGALQNFAVPKVAPEKANRPAGDGPPHMTRNRAKLIMLLLGPATEFLAFARRRDDSKDASAQADRWTARLPELLTTGPDVLTEPEIEELLAHHHDFLALVRAKLEFASEWPEAWAIAMERAYGTEP